MSFQWRRLVVDVGKQKFSVGIRADFWGLWVSLGFVYFDIYVESKDSH